MILYKNTKAKVSSLEARHTDDDDDDDDVYTITCTYISLKCIV